MTVRKIGVEEELLLVHPTTGRLTDVSAGAVRASELADGADAEVEHELFLPQIETATPPCEKADDLRAGIVAGRRAVGRSAAAAGARAVAVPAPVLPGSEQEFTRKPRYLRIEREYGELARQGLVCAMHVHVEVEDDAEGVAVIDGIRPWLPLLVAVSANSPYFRGADTGHASWRSQLWGSWPAAGPGQPFGDVDTYRAVGRRMIDWGGALDEAMLYFDVRLSAQYPTVEVRVADVCTDVEDAVLTALLARALVTTVAAERPPAPWRADLLRFAGWRAARHGLGSDLVHPVDGTLAPVRDVFEATVGYARDALEEAGDLDVVRESFERLLARGGGATRQRRVWESTGDLARVVGDLARRTEESWA
jgi:glutamate---cysteine ligase / carboxylate-amine ligase